MTPIERALAVMATLFVLMGAAGAAGPPSGPLTKCPADAVVSGTVCMDKYEASVWRVPNADDGQQGPGEEDPAGQGDGRRPGGGRRDAARRRRADDYAPCADSGQNCADDIYAVSLPGVPPSANITWFQAQAACENARKRLPSNAEWQAAVAGTPDPGPDNGTTDCNTASAFAAVATGSRSSCVSARGAFDMVGNLYEWVADWVPRSTACGTWSGRCSPTGDDQCLAGAAPPASPVRCCAAAASATARSPARSRSAGGPGRRTSGTTSASGARASCEHLRTTKERRQ